MSVIELIFYSDGDITAYRADSRYRMIQTDNHENKSIILENITPVFDGLADETGTKHFAVQTGDGGLVYLKSEGGEWRKYEIFRSKSKLTPISSIILTRGSGCLCAFYCMNHNGKNLLVRHCFSANSLYVTPYVEDILDARADFHVSHTRSGFTLFYRDVSGKRCKISYTSDYRRTAHERNISAEDIFHLRTSVTECGLHYAYTAHKKGYTAILYKGPDDSASPKVITFGITRNCIPHICTCENEIFIQWEENGRIMQSESHDGGLHFSVPATLNTACRFAALRTGIFENTQRIDVCAVCYREISVRKLICSSQPHFLKKENYDMNKSNIYRDFEDTTFFMKKLSEIEAEISHIGTELDKACCFLEKLIEFKNETTNDTYTKPIRALQTPTDTISDNADIGEKDENNIRLFESLDPDTTTPTKTILQE